MPSQKEAGNNAGLRSLNYSRWELKEGLHPQLEGSLIIEILAFVNNSIFFACFPGPRWHHPSCCKYIVLGDQHGFLLHLAISANENVSFTKWCGYRPLQFTINAYFVFDFLGVFSSQFILLVNLLLTFLVPFGSAPSTTLRLSKKP